MSRPFASRRPTIRRQLLAIVLVPSISLLAVAMAVTTYLAIQARDSSSLQKTVKDASEPAGLVILGLQQERRLSLTELVGAGDTGLAEARAQVDAGLAQVSQIIGPLASASDSTSVQRQIGSLTQHGDQLAQLRAGIDAGQVDVATAYSAYSEMIAGFGASLRTATQEAPDAASAYDQLTSVDLFYGAESLWRSITLTEVAIQSDGLPDPLVEEYQERSGAYHAQLAALQAILPASEQQQLTTIMSGNSWKTITQVQSALNSRLALQQAGAPASTIRKQAWPPVGLAAWRATMNDVGAQVAKLYAEHSAAAAERSETQVHDEEVRAWVVGAALLMIGMVVVLVAVRMSGRVAQRLRDLRDDTRRLSGSRLPEAVKALRQGQEPGIALSPLQHGDDEIGEVAEAFNEAQDTAVRAAADEARARAGTRDVFLNIARRTQGIAYQQLKLLDQAQEHVEDPNHLKLLFQLDHLATRARRHAENLVILGGKQPGRRWSQPVPLIDVVRGATGETINYEQVISRRVPEVRVASDRAADIIHILAELIDNATSFGPPGSTVEVRGEIVGKGVVLEIEDRGLGMTAEQRDQLNRQLSDVPDFGDVALSADTRLGLFVVGRLAARHEIRVTLRESVAYGGTIAVVLLPMPVLIDPLSTPGSTVGGTGPIPMPGLSMAQLFPASLTVPRPTNGTQGT
ncbi:nitrate- and nitrite sensing domain-containing protein [Kineosporia sp. J2-2]|uniref:histidine kinase n=1 Tax=Kineosporia corallincola TaxID=2835133 RepID=A0ABS5THU4_9ACTN|nr:ATP-binding protein [Kineosporia corallincola]MBT0770658.1 nitrate- and nitrite sensing domain-containing protein [Kineosporia corallincola]